jgi:hypothetical protein
MVWNDLRGKVLPHCASVRPPDKAQILINMAATRLRKTFQHSENNSDDDDIPGEMDEEGGWKQVME